MNEIDQFIDCATFLSEVEKAVCKNLSTKEEQVNYLKEKQNART